MNTTEQGDSSTNPEEWPPGTVRIEMLQRVKGEDIVLQPRPTDNPNDPLNWPMWRKHLNFGLSCFYALMVFAFIDAATPTWSPMNLQLGFSYTILNDSYALGCGTLAFGAFLLIPFALKYGRRPIYILSTAAQFGVAIWSAKLQTVADIMLVNAFSCGVGALAEVICNMTIADVYFVHQRGKMNSIYIWVQNMGGSMAPVAAGYITTSQGWRWVWWWCAIFFGVQFIAFLFCYEESKFSNTGVDASSIPLATIKNPSHAAVQQDLQQPQDAKSKDGNVVVTSSGSTSDVEAGEVGEINPTQTHINPDIPAKTYLQSMRILTTSPGKFSHFARHAWQPLVILFTIPAVFFMSLVYGVMLAWSTVMVTVLSSWMALPPYNFNASSIGLMSLPAFIGTTLGTLIAGPMSDWWILYCSRKNKGIYEPEMRLWVMIPFIPFVPAGAFMFGFGLADGSSWLLIAFGYAICNFGTAPISSIALTYITDSYTEVSFMHLVLSLRMLIIVLLDYRRRIGLGYLYSQCAIHSLRIRHYAMDCQGGHEECLHYH